MEIRNVGTGLEVRQNEVIRWWEGRWWENSEEGSLIIDLPGGRMAVADHRKKIWTGGEPASFLAEMEREIRNLTGKVRETYRLPSPGAAGGEENPFLSQLRVEKIAPEKVAGRPCQRYQIFLGKELCQDVWLDPSISPGDYFPMSELLPVLERFTIVTSIFEREFRTRDDFMKEMAIQEGLRRIFPEGLEILSREYRQGVLAYEKRTSSIRAWPGDAAAFQPPAGYIRVPYRGFLEESLPDNQDIFGSASDGTE